jgi:hypothetical protein
MIVALVVVAKPLTATAASTHRQSTPTDRPDRSTETVSQVSPPVVASPNWSGYVAYSQQFSPVSFTQVSAHWIEPTVTCPKKDAWTLFWVGFDGWPNSDGTVEQGGTSAQCVNGIPRYSAFFEMWPAESVQTQFAVNPGDHISASVNYTPDHTFVINVTDSDTGKFFNQTTTCALCARASAEWVAESPSHFGTNRWFPLANYGTMAFTQASAEATTSNYPQQSVTGAISDTQWVSSGIVRKDGAAKPKANVSALQNVGASSSFSDTWKRH